MSDAFKQAAIGNYKERAKEEIKSILKERKKEWTSIETIKTKLRDKNMDVRHEFVELCTDEIIDENQKCWVRYQYGVKELSWVYKEKESDQVV